MAQSTTATQMTNNNRKFFTDNSQVLDLPNLVDHQNRSWQWFVEEGLGELLAEIGWTDFCQ